MNTFLVCPHCDAVNRIPSHRLGDGPGCGRCRQALFAGRPVPLRLENFPRHLQRNDVPLLVDFWAPSFGPCRAMTTIMAAAAAQLEPRIRVARVNAEDEPALAAAFNIRGFPTLTVFRKGHEVARQSGVALPLPQLLSWVRGATA